MQRRSLIFVLAALSMLGALSIDAYLPALPSIARSFSASAPAVQQTLTVYLFAFAFMNLFYGTLSDSFGRRPVILVSMALYILSSLGAGLAPSLGWLFFFRLLQGMTAGAGGVVGRAMVGDLFSGAAAQRTMSYISVVFGLAPAIAPILGGWLLAAFGWRSIFGFIALFSLLLLLICFQELPESLPREKRHPFHFQVVIGHYWKAGCHARFIFKCLAIAFSFSGVLIYVGSAPAFVLNILHLSVTQFGWLFIPLIGGMTLGSALSGKLSHHFHPAVMIRAGYAAMILSVIANLGYTAFFAVKVPWAVLPMFFYGIGMMLANPAMTVVTLEMFPQNRGLASSLQSFTFMIVFALGSGLICPLLFGSAFKLALGTAIGLALSMVFLGIGQMGRMGRMG